VVRTEIDYRRGARLGDRLSVEGWLDRVERARFWCAFQIVRRTDNTLIATCRQLLALVQMPEGAVIRLPNEWEKYRDGEPAAAVKLK
jgi:acyl-CoA thioesterase FadM